MATTRTEQSFPGMTQEELLALPAAIDLQTANRALGISRSTGYSLASRGAYPAKVLRLASTYRVVTNDLLEVLGVDRLDHERCACPT